MTSDLIPDSILDFYETGDKMDKLSYKQMLADEATKVSELENEINRLQLLVAKYSDQQRKITKMVLGEAGFLEITISELLLPSSF